MCKLLDSSHINFSVGSVVWVCGEVKGSGNYDCLADIALNSADGISILGETEKLEKAHISCIEGSIGV